MLLYNHAKEFLGISESDLRSFGFSSIEELTNITGDFADLFLKSPGYIYNFKHIHWIDYILCSTPTDEHKALLLFKEKEYSLTISIDTLFLIENSMQKAYSITLSNIKDLSIKNQSSFQTMPKEEKKIPPTPYEESKETVKEKNFTLDIVPDTKQPQIAPVQAEDIHTQTNYTENYVYSLQKASDVLGLPVDLVAEFIEDYTTQANSFKEKLYVSLQNGDLTTFKTEIHKLIGVAENLKIENALDVLGKINKLQDVAALKRSLDTYYEIVDALSGKKEHSPLSFKEDSAVSDIKTATKLDTNDLLPLEFKE